jgi:hypothetical protein
MPSRLACLRSCPAVPATVPLFVPNEPVVQAQGDFSLPAVLCQDPPVADLDEPTIPRAVRPGAGGTAGHQ